MFVTPLIWKAGGGGSLGNLNGDEKAVYLLFNQILETIVGVGVIQALVRAPVSSVGIDSNQREYASNRIII